MLEAFFVSTGVVALGEIGDKTQLLALMLASRYRRPWTIVGGILAATIVNHTLAGAIGQWVRSVVPESWLRWFLALSLFAVAVWTLKPDRVEESDIPASGMSVFTVTAVSFFLAEMGDKTQIATALLAARFDSLVQVVAGTTLGMLLADVPAVFAGHLAAQRLPLKPIRALAASLFVGLGVWVLLT